MARTAKKEDTALEAQALEETTTAPENQELAAEAPGPIQDTAETAEPQEPDAAEDLQQEDADPEPVPEPESEPEPPTVPDHQDPEPVPPENQPLPYKATVAVSIAVVHKAVGIGTADMLKPVGSLRQGTPVTVVGRKGPFVKLKNGLFMKEKFLAV